VEVTATIEFVRPCLGSVRRPDYDRMHRDQDGNVIFMPSWWRAAFAQAAKALSKYYKFVDMIHPGMQVVGKVTRIKRWYGQNKFKLHEGFDVGAVVSVSFLIPSALTLNEFTEWLEATGAYIGLSAYGWKDKYGLFKVLSVAPTVRSRTVRLEVADGTEPIVDRSATSESGESESKPNRNT